jgi:hypothetical protein
MPENSSALIQNDIILLGLIAATLALIFWASSGPNAFFKRFFAIVPSLLMCYFIPSVYNTTVLIDGLATKL